MKKYKIILVILVFILVLIMNIHGTNQATNKLKNVDSIEVTFTVYAEPDKEVVLLLKGVSSITEPTKSLTLDFKGENKYQTKIKLPVGTLIEYSLGYSIDDSFQYELNTLNQAMYRTVVVSEGIEEIEHYFHMGNENTRTVEISVIDNDNNPIRGIIVDIDGLRRKTMDDGSVVMHKVREKDQLVTIFDLENKYVPKTIKLSDLVLPIKLNKRSTMSIVKFEVKPPKDMPNASIKVVGKSDQFGFKYFQLNELQFPENSSQILELKEVDGKFVGEIELPTGMVLGYTYSTATSRIGLEKNNNSNLMRYVTVEDGLVVKDSIASFKANNDQLITFNLEADSEYVNIQIQHNFIKMDKVDKGFKASFYYQPTNKLNYRYMYGVKAHSSEYLGPHSYDDYEPYDYMREVDFTESIVLNDEVSKWIEYEPIDYKVEFSSKVRTDLFTGIMMADLWNSSHFDYTEYSIKHMSEFNMDYLMHSPVWNFSSIINNPILEATGHELYSVSVPDTDLKNWLQSANDYNMRTAFYSQVNPEMMDSGIDEFFNSGAKSDDWWNDYLKELERFTIYYAKIASENDVDLFRIPDTFMGTTLNMFEDEDQMRMFDKHMNNMVDKIKTFYSGKLYTSVEIYNNIEFYFTYFDKMDYLSNKHWYSIVDLDKAETEFREELTRYKKAAERYNKPYFVDQLAFFLEEADGVENVDIAIADYYNKMFEIINEEDWIKGVILFGYPYEKNSSPMVYADNVIKQWFDAFSN